MKTISIHIIFMLVTNMSFAQTVSGQVQEADGKPLAFATVLLYHSTDSVLVKGAITTEAGQFTFDRVTSGSYFLQVTAIGYHKVLTKDFALSAQRPSHQLPDLIAVADVQQLNEVTVKTQKPLFEQQIDRLVIHLQNSAIAVGGTALDVLERAPGVSLDRQDNKLSLNGKSSVLVMINGKLNRIPIDALLQQLAGLPTGSIEKIELIANPPARFDAEGDAGLINIVLRKSLNEGLSGTYTLSAGYGFYEKAIASGLLNYRAGRLALFGDYSFNYDHIWQQWQFDWKLQSTVGNGYTQTSTVANRFAKMPQHTARAGFEYSLNPHFTVSGMLSGFDSRWTMQAKSQAQFQQQTSDMRSNVITDEVNHWQHLMGNLSLRYRTPKTDLSLDIDRLYYNNNQPTTYTNTYESIAPKQFELPAQMIIGKKTPFGMWVAKVDIVRTISPAWKLETGLKVSTLSLNNTVVTQQLIDGNWFQDSLFSQRTTMAESIWAGYVSTTGRLAKKWQIQGGLRAEATQTQLLSNGNLRLVDRRYLNVFPSIFATYEIDKKRSFQISYSRRITRPPYKVLAPTMIFIGPTTLRTGNPGILPTISDAVQLSYRFKENYLLSLRYAFDKNQFFDYQPQIDHSDPNVVRQIFTTRNIDKTQTVTTTFSVPWIITDWWQSQTQLLGVWQHSSTAYGSTNLSFGQLYGQINTTHTLRLNAQSNLELAAFYNTPSQTMGIFKREAFGSLTVGWQQKLAKEKGIIRISVSDLFWTNKRVGSYTLTDQNMVATTAAILEPRIVRVSFTRNVGSQSIKNAARRKTGSEEERERAN